MLYLESEIMHTYVPATGVKKMTHSSYFINRLSPKLVMGSFCDGNWNTFFEIRAICTLIIAHILIFQMAATFHIILEFL